MQIGVAFPRQVLGLDVALMRDFVAAVDQVGYDYIQFGEHVLGVDPSTRAGWADRGAPVGTGIGLYDYQEIFHEPFVFMSWLSHFSERLVLMTATLTLPMRQTPIVAKQAAELDLLTGGRLILGVGVGWNSEEYAALGMDFHTRGARIDEQIEVLRALWTREIVHYEGRWHHIDGLGINPLPVRRIPIWMGGGPGAPRAVVTSAAVLPGEERVLRRVARLADGWITGGYLDPASDGARAVERLRGYAEEAGRDAAAIAVQGSVILAKHPARADWPAQARQWQDAGASHLVLIPTNAAETDSKYGTVDGLVTTLTEFRDAIA
jgi:probable F420-dependent oxidoreductase